MNQDPYRKEYWNQERMGLWERVYILEVIRGLWITGGVFLGNMFKWITFRKGALTTFYPEERRADYSTRNRGRHLLTLRQDGTPQCVTCNLCATVCPARCIEIESRLDGSDFHHPKNPARFYIDYSRCIFCGFCVEACPEDAIRMHMDVPDLPADRKVDLWVDMEYLTKWNPQRDPAKKYPLAERSQQEGK
jgi:NADH-quinone oxidoreductase subunit I